MQMKCKYHPKQDATQFCKSCGIPLCGDCAEEAKPGEYYCFQCAMIHSVSEVGSTIVDKRDKAAKKKLEKKKPWGPFRYFVTVSSVLIVVMWGVILLGGQTAPGGNIDFEKQGRVFLFMVDSSIKRYAHYENNNYPNSLTDLVPKYLRMRKEDLPQLNKLSYKKDPSMGYKLSFANPKPTDTKIIISPKGISYEPAKSEGV